MRKRMVFSLFLLMLAFVVTACGSSQEPEEAGDPIEAIPLAVETTTPVPELDDPEAEVVEPEPTNKEPEAYPPPDDTAGDSSAEEPEAYPPPGDTAGDSGAEESEAYPPPDDTTGDSNTDGYPPPTNDASDDSGDPPDEATMAAFARAGCAGCHTIAGVPKAVGLIGPNLSAIGAEASERKAGLDAENYIRESILDPAAFIAPVCPAGECPAGVMPPNFKERLTDDEINLIVAYLLTLTNGQ